jgi:hypothetical protein
VKLLSLSSGCLDRFLRVKPCMDPGGELGVADLAALEAGEGGDVGADGVGDHA